MNVVPNSHKLGGGGRVVSRFHPGTSIFGQYCPIPGPGVARFGVEQSKTGLGEVGEFLQAGGVAGSGDDYHWCIPKQHRFRAGRNQAGHFEPGDVLGIAEEGDIGRSAQDNLVSQGAGWAEDSFDG